MKDKTKAIIGEKLSEALRREGITKKEATKLLKFGHDNYIIWATAKSPQTRAKCPSGTWDVLQSWTNSGQSLWDFSANRPDQKPKVIYKPEFNAPPEVRRTEEEIKQDRLYDELRSRGLDLSHEDAWFRAMCWIMDEAAKRNLSLRISITEK